MAGIRKLVNQPRVASQIQPVEILGQFLQFSFQVSYFFLTDIAAVFKFIFENQKEPERNHVPCFEFCIYFGMLHCLLRLLLWHIQTHGLEVVRVAK
jgi:hypothetical protein